MLSCCGYASLHIARALCVTLVVRTWCWRIFYIKLIYEYILRALRPIAIGVNMRDSLVF